MAEAFPQTFFTDLRQVQPLKVNIHQDLIARLQAGDLSAELDEIKIKRFLHWYTRQTAYLKAIAQGMGRVDLTGAVVDTDLPPAIRQQAQDELMRRRPHQTTRLVPPATALLAPMAAAFPQTFSTEPAQVRPLKGFIYRDLIRCWQAGTLPTDIDRLQLKPFLRWYTGRTSYLNALARNLRRVDLTGAIIMDPIPEAVRRRARAEVQHRHERQAAKAAATTAAVKSPPPAPKPDPAPYSLEDLYAMAVDAKLEVTLKFTTLPNAKATGQGKMAFALKTPSGQFVTTEVNTKAWNKLLKAAEEWPNWTAALVGTMGPPTDQGFKLENPGLQVFERKPKAPDESAPPPAVAAAKSEVPATPPATPPPPVVETSPSPPPRKAVLSLKKGQNNPAS